MGGDDDEPAGYASPPCLLHEVDPAYSGLAPPSPAAWRKTERERLIAAKIRGRWRVRLSDLEAYIDAHTAGRRRT